MDTDWNRAIGNGGGTPRPDAGLAALIDFSQMDAVFADFLAVTGLPVAIIDLNGKVLASSKWQRICMDYHRVNVDTLTRCLKSDITLSSEMRGGKDIAIYRCHNGLTDCAAPIVVDGHHLANLFIGQFLLEEPDRAFFKRQQEQFGFDEAEYFKALAEVPIVAEAKLPAILNLVVGLARQVADLSLARMRAMQAQAEVESSVDERTRQLSESEARLNAAERIAQIGSWELDLAHDKLSWSPGIFRIFEIDPRHFEASYQAFLDAIHPDDREAVNQAYSDSLVNRRPYEITHRLKLPDGRVKYVHECCETLFDDAGKPLRSRGTVQDVTERKHAGDALAQSQLELQTIIETEPECVKLLDAHGTLLRMNRAGLDMIDADTPDQVVGKRVSGIITPPHRAAFRALTRRVFKGESGNLEFEIRGLKGTHRWLDTHAVPLRDPQGNITALLGLTRDITERKRAEQALRIAATAFESQEGMIVTDADGIILQANRAFTELTGYHADEIVGKTPAMLKSGRQDLAFYQRMWDELLRNGIWRGEIWNRRKDGEIHPEWLVITAVKGADGAVTHYVGAFTDITLRKEAEEQIRTLAFYDSLTQLPNRRLLLDRLGQALAGGERSRRHGALMFLDLDHFKTLNDTRGHDVGDLLLVEVALRLRACMREGDTVSRLGGDEFIIILEDLSTEARLAATQAEEIAVKIQGALNQPYVLRTGDGREIQDFHCAASLGICLFLGHRVTIEELLKRADVAMYQAKAAGRNTTRFFDPDMQAVLDARMVMESELRQAIARGEFQLYYQIQIDRDRRVVGAEALLRWNHPRRGIVLPAEFIPLAEETGLIVPIGLWVLERACGQLAAWAGDPDRARLRLAVNLSPRQFRQANFVDQVREVLMCTGADTSRLKLELTESLVLDNVEETIAKMQALNALGVGFSMDDFGTGFSSLSYLKRLPLDQLKIDRSFVMDLEQDDNDATICAAIISLAHNLGLQVVAEGVETEGQRRFLADVHRCDFLQGYLFGRPVPADEFERALDRHSIQHG